jgi:hypothetical protein
LTTTVRASIFEVAARSTGPRKILPGAASAKILRKLASTSSAVRGLPLWKVTPDRSLITHSVSEVARGVICSARRYCTFLAWMSRVTRGSYRVWAREMSMSVTALCGSMVSAADPPVRPACRSPPYRLRGAAAGRAGPGVLQAVRPPAASAAAAGCGGAGGLVHGGTSSREKGVLRPGTANGEERN